MSFTSFEQLFANVSAPSAPGNTEDAVTTIYMVGFPEDFKERELANLFVFAKGFEGCSLRSASQSTSVDPALSPLLRACLPAKTSQTIGFARFRTISEALDACRILNGRILDPEKGAVTLKVEMAKKNLHLAPCRSRSAIAALNLEGINLSLQELELVSMARRNSAPSTEIGHQIPCKIVPNVVKETTASSICKGIRALSLCVPGSANPVSIMAPIIIEQPAQRSVPNSVANRQMSQAAPTSPAQDASILSENPPCNTLYVGNLPPNASEMELRSIFMTMSGFRRLSFKPKPGSTPMCFVEFEDVGTATAAMESLYGTMLSNSTKGGIRLSYSKNPLGVKAQQAASLQQPLSTCLSSSLFNDIFAFNANSPHQDSTFKFSDDEIKLQPFPTMPEEPADGLSKSTTDFQPPGLTSWLPRLSDSMAPGAHRKSFI